MDEACVHKWLKQSSLSPVLGHEVSKQAWFLLQCLVDPNISNILPFLYLCYLEELHLWTNKVIGLFPFGKPHREDTNPDGLELGI